MGQKMLPLECVCVCWDTDTKVRAESQRVRDSWLHGVGTVGTEPSGKTGGTTEI